MSDYVINDIQRLSQRIKSFTDWTSPKDPIELALAGYRYTGELDRVKCDYCNKKVVQWTVNDNALEVHARFEPDCIFLRHLGYSRSLQLPRFSNFSKYSDRFESVSTVPLEYHQSLPALDKIAEAGFFYQGTLDRMGCYHCGLILRDWESHSDPIAIHKRFRPNCLYISRLEAVTFGSNLPTLAIGEQSTFGRVNIERSACLSIANFILENGNNWLEEPQNLESQLQDAEVEEQTEQQNPPSVNPNPNNPELLDAGNNLFDKREDFPDTCRNPFRPAGAATKSSYTPFPPLLLEVDCDDLGDTQFKAKVPNKKGKKRKNKKKDASSESASIIAQHEKRNQISDKKEVRNTVKNMQTKNLEENTNLKIISNDHIKGANRSESSQSTEKTVENDDLGDGKQINNSFVFVVDASVPDGVVGDVRPPLKTTLNDGAGTRADSSLQMTPPKLENILETSKHLPDKLFLRSLSDTELTDEMDYSFIPERSDGYHLSELEFSGCFNGNLEYRQISVKFYSTPITTCIQVSIRFQSLPLTFSSVKRNDCSQNLPLNTIGAPTKTNTLALAVSYPISGSLARISKSPPAAVSNFTETPKQSQIPLSLQATVSQITEIQSLPATVYNFTETQRQSQSLQATVSSIAKTPRQSQIPQSLPATGSNFTGTPRQPLVPQSLPTTISNFDGIPRHVLQSLPAAASNFMDTPRQSQVLQRRQVTVSNITANWRQICPEENETPEPHPLPPMYNREGFSELPMIQAVLQMGEVTYDSVVNTICTRYDAHGDTFPDAQSLFSSILDSGVTE
ncbi:hypothetical protein SNE40_008817 [Patella caerulea]|uniref:Uncharacterized protein n=1 Tax=Patella caerulea TaxID=87958 RepID=A0AAN8PR73_PATCE